jgi:hypothetical protein
MQKTILTFPAASIASTGRIACNTGQPAVFSLLGTEYLSVTANPVGSTNWSAGVVTLRVGNNQGGPFRSLPSTITLTASAPVTTVVDVRGYGWAVLDVTTAETSVVLDVAVCLYRSN